MTNDAGSACLSQKRLSHTCEIILIKTVVIYTHIDHTDNTCSLTATDNYYKDARLAHEVCDSDCINDRKNSFTFLVILSSCPWADTSRANSLLARHASQG